MSESERYRRLAAETRVLARKAETTREADSYLAIARAWDQLADEADRVEVSRPEPRPDHPPEPSLPV